MNWDKYLTRSKIDIKIPKYPAKVCQQQSQKIVYYHLD